jgi:hypothetical protein
MRFQQYYAFVLYGFLTVLKLFDEINTLINNNKNGTTKTTWRKSNFRIYEANNRENCLLVDFHIATLAIY